MDPEYLSLEIEYKVDSDTINQIKYMFRNGNENSNCNSAVLFQILSFMLNHCENVNLYGNELHKCQHGGKSTLCVKT